MQNIHLQFNNNLIEEIKRFYLSKNDVLLFYAPSGTGKNTLLNIALDEYKDSILKFYYYCNHLTVIEDFLLGFYDTLRDYTIQKKIILKKDLSDDFTKKVSNYMKALDKDTIIVIDNYDKIQDNESINDFLSDISKQEKTRLILLSSADVSLDKFRNKGLSVVKVTKQKYEDDALIQKISLFCPAEDLDSIKELSKISNESTILLQTTFNYINATNTRLFRLIDEFYKKSQSYEQYITSKTMSLIPQNYMDSIKILSLTNFITTTTYLEKYALFNTKYVSYLQQRLIVNQVNQNIYERENVKNYFSENLSVADKMQYGGLIINSLNQELSRGPKDRILRLSREGIRLQIENLEKNTPYANPNAPTSTEVSYYSQVQNSTAPWLDKNSASDVKADDIAESSAQQDLEMLKQFRKTTYEHKVQEQENKELSRKKDLNNKIKQYEDAYDFKNAILCLEELEKIDKENENIIIEKIANNYSKLHKNNEAISYLTKLSDNYKNNNNMQEYYNILFKIANIKLKKYSLDEAVLIYNKIIKEDKNPRNIINSYCALGNIEERKNNNDNALKNYKNALKISIDNNINEKASEICYLIGTLNEKQNKNNEAKENYQNSIKFGDNNITIGDSYLSLALLLFDENNINDAIYNFEKAISKFEQEKTPKVSSLYIANSNLAYIYRSANSNKEEAYLQEALKWAQIMGDRFEIASTNVTLGDFYYNKSKNKDALLNYLHAKDSLNEDKASQNHQVIASRIEDMKYKLGNEFNNIVEEYERTKK